METQFSHIFRCNQCGSVFASTDGRGLCNCAVIAFPHPPGWTEDVDDDDAHVGWTCDACEAENDWAILQTGVVVLRIDEFNFGDDKKDKP